MIFDYVDGGAGDEVTVRRNREAFERLAFRPRALVDVSRRELAVTVLDDRLASPVLEADDGGHLHFLGAAVGVGERPEEVRVPRHRLERRNGGPVAAGLLRALVDDVPLGVFHEHGEALLGIRAVLRVGEESDHDLRAVAQEAGRGVGERHSHRLEPLGLPRAICSRLDVARDPAAERGGVSGGPAEHRSRVAGRNPQLARLGWKAAQACGGLAHVAGRAPIAVALRSGVRVAIRPAAAKSLENGGAHDGHLVVHRRLQSVELSGEPRQGLREPILLAGHRKRVVDDEEDVGLRRHFHLAVLRHGDQCRRLHRDRDVALAGRSRDEQREKGYNSPDAHQFVVPPEGTCGGKLEMVRRPVKVAMARPAAGRCKAFARVCWVATLGVRS